MSTHDQTFGASKRRAITPSPAEIARRAACIRAAWSEAERRFRRQQGLQAIALLCMKS